MWTGECRKSCWESYVRILYLEDEPKDAELVQASLEAEGFVCDLTRAETQAEFLKNLQQGGFALILADYSLPHFDGISALKIAQEICPEVPFIFVSGTMGEELAIEALKQGATDYVLKTRLSRIAPSARRALREAEERSQRKQAEQALQRNQAYLAQAQRLSQTGSFGWHIASGKIYWSDQTYRIFDVEVGIPPTLDLAFERIHPADRRIVQEVIDRATHEAKEFDFEHRLLMPDGYVKYVRVVGRPSAPIGSDDLEFVGAVTDITQRKRAEQELQELVDLVPQVIVVFDAEGKRIHANRFAREYTGLKLEEYLSEQVMIRRVVHPDDAPKMRTARERGFALSAPFDFEARLLGRDGVYRWFLFRHNPLVEEGRVRRWYGSATEIESRKQEEDRVRKENVRLEERTRIAQDLHDTLLQTFLSASMLLSVAADDVPSASQVKLQLDRILQIMRQGIEEGRNTIQGLRSTGTPDLVQALSRVPQELTGQRDIDFRVIVVGHQEPLRAPIWHEMYRIGKEALVNAFSHSRAKYVEFQLEYADGVLRMRIRDNGRGIDPQVLQAGRDGHWGLAGMRERAERIGGTLNISSSATIGTEIQLSIPGSVAFQLSHPNGAVMQ